MIGFILTFCHKKKDRSADRITVLEEKLEASRRQLEDALKDKADKEEQLAAAKAALKGKVAALEDALKGKADKSDLEKLEPVLVMIRDEIKRHRTSMTVPPPHPFESPSKGMRVRLARQAKRKLYEAETPARRRRLCKIILGALMKQSPFYDGTLMIHHKSDSEQVLEMIEEIKEIWEDEGIVGNE